MNMKTIQAYSYNILDDLNMEIKITKNDYSVDINELFDLAARINKNRSFLFVSKVLGKHIPAKPQQVIYAGRILGEIYAKEKYGIKPNSFDQKISLKLEEAKKGLLAEKIELLEENIIIGFAETATALGHSVFETFNNAKFINTTREPIGGEPIFDFKEEHSHATSQTVFTFDDSFFDNESPIILVDDEITTGKTALNIINKIHAKYPRKCYIILTILDWRLEEHKKRYKKLEEQLGVKIEVYSLVSGDAVATGKAELENDSYDDYLEEEEFDIKEHYFGEIFEPVYRDYIKFTGRFGIDSNIHNRIDEITQKIANGLDKIRNKKLSKRLVLGVGEFMFFPLKIASYMEGDIYYHSTTRSPILVRKKENYGIQSKFEMYNIYDETINEFLYNVPKNFYDSVYIIYERYSKKKDVDIMKEKLKKLGIKDINICFMTS